MCGFGLPVKRRVTLTTPPCLGYVPPLVEDNKVTLFGVEHFLFNPQPHLIYMLVSKSDEENSPPIVCYASWFLCFSMYLWIHYLAKGNLSG